MSEKDNLDKLSGDQKKQSAIFRAASFFWQEISYFIDRIASIMSKPIIINTTSVERSVSSTSDYLVRNFERLAALEYDKAASKLAAQSDELIKKGISAKIDEKFGGDLLSVIGEKVAEVSLIESKKRKRETDFSDRFDRMRDRALGYAAKAEIQSTMYRLFGVFFAVLGVALLAYTVMKNLDFIGSDPKLIDKTISSQFIALRYLPTFSFVLFVEALALVMFRYQSKALEHMRYFSNEATNIDARRLAFLTALEFDDRASMSYLIKSLDGTERNFKLGKGEGTLETANNENENSVLDIIKPSRGKPTGSAAKTAQKKPKPPPAEE